MKKTFLILILTALCCSAICPPAKDTDADYNTAFEIAIADFLKCGLCKKYDAFYVSLCDRNEYERYKISEEVLTVSIFPTETKNRIMPIYYITMADTVGSKRLPTRHIIKNGKLFYWYDSDYELTEEIIKVFLEYKIADRTDIPSGDYLLGQEWQGIDERTKTAQYYFCKNNLSKHKKVITSIGTGWYKPPKIKCK